MLFTKVERLRLADLALLAAPAVGGKLRQESHGTDMPGGVALAVVFGIVNGLAEELLWRGVFATTFHDRLRGCLYPAVGFGAWHIAPLSVYPGTTGSFRFASLATLFGLVYGEVARPRHGIAWTTFSRVVTDYLGTDLGWFSELTGGAFGGGN